MKFVLVNDRTPGKPPSCMPCDEPIKEATFEKSGPASSTAVMIATRITAKVPTRPSPI